MTIKYLSSQALEGFDFRTKPQHSLTMQQGSDKIQDSCSRLSRMRTDREAQRKTEGPWVRQGPWGGDSYAILGIVEKLIK